MEYDNNLLSYDIFMLGYYDLLVYLIIENSYEYYITTVYYMTSSLFIIIIQLLTCCTTLIFNVYKGSFKFNNVLLVNEIEMIPL